MSSLVIRGSPFVDSLNHVKQNLILRSETFDNATWVKTNTTVAANEVANPFDSAVTADSVTDSVDGGAVLHVVAQSFTSIPGQRYTFSVYAKNVSIAVPTILLFVSGAFGGAGVFFNLVSGLYSIAGPDSAAMEVLADGWYRLSMTGVCHPGATSSNFGVCLDDGSNTTIYTGAGTKACYLFGAQVTISPAAMPYNVTTSAAIGSSLPPRSWQTHRTISNNWEPSLLSNPVGWWRADNVTLTSGKVSTWPDKFPTAINASQATAGQRPTQVASIVNGRPVVRFVQASSTILETVVFATVAQPVTYWLVAKGNIQTGLPAPFGGPSGNPLMYANSATSIAFQAGNQFNYTYDITAKFATYVIVFNSTSSLLRIDGAQVTTGDPGTGAIAPTMSIGGANGFGIYWDGDIAEIGVVSQALSGADLIQLENYLRAQYGTW